MSGIGAETARHLASLGGIVVLVGRNEDRLNKVVDEIKIASDGNSSSEPLVIVADLAKNVSGIVEKTIDQFGRLDVLVNNAGINIEVPILEGTNEQLNQIFNTNVFSIINLCKLAVPHLERTKGNIVNVANNL